MAEPVTVLLVGHGSRDPRSPGALRDLRDRVAVAVAAEAAVADAEPPAVGLAFLELSAPLLEDVLIGLRGEVLIVPLLLTTAFHARVDLPGRVRAATEHRADLDARICPALGPHPLLDAAVAGRARGLLAQGHDGIVLLGTGSSHASANGEAAGVAARLQLMLEVPVSAAFVTRGPDLPDTVRTLRARGSRNPAVVPWFLAPGTLLDLGIRRAAEFGVDAVAQPLSGDRRIVDLVVSRAGRVLETVC